MNNNYFSKQCCNSSVYISQLQKKPCNKIADYGNVLQRQYPDAVAQVKGGNGYDNICGEIKFYQTPQGVIVVSYVDNLPVGTKDCNKVFGFHIHTGESCTGNLQNEFADTLGHYNPYDNPHPCHSGDLPPLFGNYGVAYAVVLTNRFTVNEVIGKAVVIHLMPDDFTTQPSGNSGTMIACGIINK